MTDERTINIMRDMEELRAEARNADPAERRQIEAELAAAIDELEATVGAEPPH